MDAEQASFDASKRASAGWLSEAKPGEDRGGWESGWPDAEAPEMSARARGDVLLEGSEARGSFRGVGWAERTAGSSLRLASGGKAESSRYFPLKQEFEADPERSESSRANDNNSILNY